MPYPPPATPIHLAPPPSPFGYGAPPPSPFGAGDPSSPFAGGWVSYFGLLSPVFGCKGNSSLCEGNSSINQELGLSTQHSQTHSKPLTFISMMGVDP